MMRTPIIGVLLAIAIAGLWVWNNFAAFQRLAVPAAEIFLSKAVLRLPAQSDQRFVVLTIDDAPSSRTEEILSILEQHDVHATFFIHTDQINTPEREAVMHRIGSNGHELASHLPRDFPAAKLSQKEFESAFARADAKLAAYGAAKKNYFRPPHGAYRARRMDASLKAHGYDRPLAQLGSDRRYILASFIPWDAGGATETDDPVHNRRTAERYADELLRNIYPGAIVIFHDGEEGGRAVRLNGTMISLERFLKGAGDQGYDIVSLSEGVLRLANTE